jgi:hydroxypyruvate reductase
LVDIYLATLARCAPDVLVRAHVDASMPRNVVAIGKCAGALLDGVASVHAIEHAFVAMPEGYRPPLTRAEVHLGGHPEMTPASFEAGRALLAFIEKHDDLLFLISGGGSACVEVPLASEEETAKRNRELIASGLPIAAINAERAKLSAMKGGKLRERIRGRCVTLVYSDVATGQLSDVASGPTAGSEMHLIADNSTLVRTAASLVSKPIVLEQQIDGDVEDAAQLLAKAAESLRAGETLIAGGEPTVTVKSTGKGGRTIELALRFAMHARPGLRALFASSDGVDGNSGAAGVHIPAIPTLLDRHRIATALGQSDSMSVVTQVGEPIMIAPTGNNLRDLFLVARD